MTPIENEDPYEFDYRQIETIQTQGKLNLTNSNSNRFILEQTVPEPTTIIPGKNNFKSLFFY